MGLLGVELRFCSACEADNVGSRSSTFSLEKNTSFFVHIRGEDEEKLLVSEPAIVSYVTASCLAIGCV